MARKQASKNESTETTTPPNQPTPQETTPVFSDVPTPVLESTIDSAMEKRIKREIERENTVIWRKSPGYYVTVYRFMNGGSYLYRVSLMKIFHEGNTHDGVAITQKFSVLDESGVVYGELGLTGTWSPKSAIEKTPQDSECGLLLQATQTRIQHKAIHFAYTDSETKLYHVATNELQDELTWIRMVKDDTTLAGQYVDSVVESYQVRKENVSKARKAKNESLRAWGIARTQAMAKKN